MDKKRSDRFKRWMIASFFLIPLVLFGSIGVYYAYFPVKMNILINLLRYDKTEGWAYDKIFNQREKAMPYVIRALSNNSPKVRYASTLILSWLAYEGIEDERAVVRLIKLLSYPDADVRSSVATALGNIGDKRAIPGLIELLSDPDAEVQASAVFALRDDIFDKRAVPGLIKLLSHPQAQLRYWAAWVLGALGDKRAVPDLIKLLSDPDADVRLSAARALAGIGSDEAAGSLIAALKEAPLAGDRTANCYYLYAHIVDGLDRITGQSFGNMWHASDAQRQEIIQKWLNWWEENKEKYEAEVPE